MKFGGGLFYIQTPIRRILTPIKKRYMKEQDVSVLLCEETAPKSDYIYTHSSIFVIGDWAGDSRGFA